MLTGGDFIPENINISEIEKKKFDLNIFDGDIESFLDCRISLLRIFKYPNST